MKKILQIKKRREDKACGLLQDKKIALEKAQKFWEGKKKELANFHKWRIEHEQELFQEVVQQSLQTKELEIYRFKVTKLRVQEKAKKADVEKARLERKHAREEEQEARNHYNQAVRNRKKIEEFNKKIDEQLRKNEERKTEKELEDIPNRKRSSSA